MSRKTALTYEQKVQQAVAQKAEDIELKLYKAKISKKAVADAAGLTRQAVSTQFRVKRLMPEVEAASEILLQECP